MSGFNIQSNRVSRVKPPRSIVVAHAVTFLKTPGVYLRQCELDPGFIRIDCSDENGMMLPPDAISAAVQAVVEQKLK